MTTNETNKVEKEIRIQGVLIRDYRMNVHLNTGKVHSTIYRGRFECEGKPLHGKTFTHESHIKVKGFCEYGDMESMFYLDEKDSQTFKSMFDLIDHHHRVDATIENQE